MKRFFNLLGVRATHNPPVNPLTLWIEAFFNTQQEPMLLRKNSMHLLTKQSQLLQAAYEKFSTDDEKKAIDNMNYAKRIYDDLVCAVNEITARFPEEQQNIEEKKVISKALSAQAHFLYKTSDGIKDMPSIQKLITEALALDPENHEAQRYQLELDFNKLHP